MKKFKTLLFSTVPFLVSLGIQYAVVFYIMFIAAIFMFGIAPALTGNAYNYNDFMALAANMDFNTIVMIVFSLCSSIVFGIWYSKRCGGTFHLDIKKQVHPLEVLGIVFLIPGTQYLSSLVAGIVSTIFPSWLEAYEELLETAGLSGDISVIMMIYSVLLAPIGEELVFRGVTLGIAQRAFPFWIANIIQAVLFGAFHMNMLQGCYTFVIGLVLGYIYHKGGSIYHVIFYHFLFNLWGTTAAEWLIVEDPALQGFIIMACTVFGLGFGFFFFNKGNAQKQ